MGGVATAARGTQRVDALGGARVADGPVAKLPFRHRIPHGLHGCFIPRGPPAQSQGADPAVFTVAAETTEEKGVVTPTPATHAILTLLKAGETISGGRTTKTVTQSL